MDQEWKEFCRQCDQKLESKETVEEKMEGIQTLLKGYDPSFKFHFITAYNKHRREKAHHIIMQKKGYSNKGLFMEVEKQKELYKQNEAFIKALTAYKNSLSLVEQKKEKSTTTSKREKVEKSFSVPLEDIKKLDEYFRGNTLSQCMELDRSICKIALLELKQTYYMYQKEAKRLYAEAKKNEDLLLEKKMYEYRRTITKVLQYISYKENRLSKLDQIEQRKQKRIQSFHAYVSEEEMDDRAFSSFLKGEKGKMDQKIGKYLLQVQERKVLKIVDPTSFSLALRYFIRNRSIEAGDIHYLNVFMSSVWNLEEKKEISKEEVETLILTILDTIQSKKKRIGKGEEERVLLKRMYQYLEVYLSLYRTATPKKRKQHFYYYDMCISLTQNPDYFPILEELLSKIPNLLNARNMDHSVFTEIVDSYIKMKKWELGAEKGDHIPSSHYYTVCRLFLENPQFKCYDVEVLEEIIQNYKGYLEDRKGLTEEKREEALLEIDQMLQKGVFIQNKRPSLDDIRWNTPSMGRKEEENDSKTLSYGGPYAFSVRPTGGYTQYLCLHEPNLNTLAKQNPLLEAYLYDTFIHGEKSGLDGKTPFYYEEGKTVPTITYQVEVFPDGTFGNFTFFKSETTVDAIVTSLKGYRDQEFLKKHVAVYRSLSKSKNKDLSLEDMQGYFAKICKRQAMKNAKEKDAPMIRYKTLTDEEERMKILDTFWSYLNKIDKTDAKTFSSILQKNRSYRLYTNNWNSSLEDFIVGDFELDYRTLLNQRILLGQDEDYTLKDSIEAVTAANHHGELAFNKVREKRFRWLTKR